MTLAIDLSDHLQKWLWGDGLATWLAFIGAAVALFFAARAASREKRRDLREQASLVTVWPDKDDLGSANFAVLNSSKAPVWSVQVFAQEWTGPTENQPNSTRRNVGKFDVGVTPPHGQPRYFTPDLAALNYVDSGYLYAIEFRDSSNKWWHRTPGGELKPDKFKDRDKFPRVEWLVYPGHGSTR